MCLVINSRLNQKKLLLYRELTWSLQPWALAHLPPCDLATVPMAKAGDSDWLGKWSDSYRVPLLKPTVKPMTSRLGGGAGFKETEIFFQRKKKKSEIFTTSCCHQLLGPAQYKFSQGQQRVALPLECQGGEPVLTRAAQTVLSHPTCTQRG